MHTQENHKIHALQLNNLIASFRAVLKAAKGKKKLKSRLISDANTVSKNYYIIIVNSTSWKKKGQECSTSIKKKKERSVRNKLDCYSTSLQFIHKSYQRLESLKPNDSDLPDMTLKEKRPQFTLSRVKDIVPAKTMTLNFSRSGLYHAWKKLLISFCVAQHKCDGGVDSV